MTLYEIKETAKGVSYKNTDYTKTELKQLALTIALQKVDEWQRKAEEDGDFEAYRHYEALKEAYQFLIDEEMEES